MYLPQDQDGAAERAGPLAEIEFWRSRTVDLGGIRDQLDDTSEQAQQDLTCILLLNMLQQMCGASVLTHSCLAAPDQTVVTFKI